MPGLHPLPGDESVGADWQSSRLRDVPANPPGHYPGDLQRWLSSSPCHSPFWGTDNQAGTTAVGIESTALAWQVSRRALARGRLESLANPSTGHPTRVPTTVSFIGWCEHASSMSPYTAGLCGPTRRNGNAARVPSACDRRRSPSPLGRCATCRATLREITNKEGTLGATLTWLIAPKVHNRL